jgi:dTDP-glucose 4,6-dehydratase
MEGWRLMRVLLTGANGFAGSHFLDHTLRTTDWHVTCIARGAIPRLDEVRYSLNYGRGVDSRVRVANLDLTEAFAPGQFGDIDWMVCYASDADVAKSVREPAAFFNANASIALHTLSLARYLKLKGVIWISSAEVAGPLYEYQKPHSEWCTTLPPSPYSASKAAQEALCFSYWRTYGVPVVIVRCLNMFGERQQPAKMIPSTISKILKGEEVVIYADEKGNVGTRDYLHARNLADGIKFIMENLSPERYGFTDRPDMYNVVSGHEEDNLSLSKLIATELDLPLRYRLREPSVDRPGHDTRYALSPNKLTGLGWTPPMSFEESLSKTVRWLKNNRRWLNP